MRLSPHTAPGLLEFTPTLFTYRSTQLNLGYIPYIVSVLAFGTIMRGIGSGFKRQSLKVISLILPKTYLAQFVNPVSALRPFDTQ